MMALLLALQDTAAPTAPAMLAIDFDLAKAPQASPESNPIIVTGRRPNLRLPPLTEQHEDLLPKAQIGLFGGVARITTESKDLLGGVTSARIMIRWTLKF